MKASTTAALRNAGVASLVAVNGSAGRPLLCAIVDPDDRDPAAHWAMGRALWLRGRQDESLQELEKAVDLSPNFALGHYTLGFVQSQAGDPL